MINITQVYGGGREVSFVHEWVDSVKEHKAKAIKILEKEGITDVKVRTFEYNN